MNLRKLKSKDIEKYAEGAKAELQDQLSKACTNSKRIKIIQRLHYWEWEYYNKKECK